MVLGYQRAFDTIAAALTSALDQGFLRSFALGATMCVKLSRDQG